MKAKTKPNATRPSYPALTQEHKDAMREVRQGGDVFCRRLASLLREVERLAPSLISIGKPQCREYGVREKHPYFGAILTPTGRKFVGTVSSKAQPQEA